jgi:hypothetical protein
LCRYKPEFDVFGPNNEPQTVDWWLQLGSDCEAVAIVEFSSVWFAAKMFGVSALVRAVQVFPRDRLIGYSFVQPEGDAAKHDDSDNKSALSFLDAPSNAPKRKAEVKDENETPNKSIKLEEPEAAEA